MKRNILLLICVAFIIIFLAGCSPPTPILNYSPKAGNLYVTSGQTVDFNINSNIDDSGYTYAWSVDGEAPIIGDTKTFSWTAPAAPAQCTVTATVTKASTQKATKSWTVKVCESVNFSCGIVKYTSEGIVALAGATVQIIGTGIDIYSTISDNSGNITFTNLPAGTFFIRVAESSIKTRYDLCDVTQSGLGLCMFSTADYVAQFAAMGITADLATKSMLGGGIFESDKVTPMIGATVTITPSSGNIMYMDSDGGFNSALTATTSLGGYCIFDIENGSYTITPVKAGKTFDPLTLDINESAIFSAVHFKAQ